MADPLVLGDPRQLGSYWLASRLGAGGQGVVYEGYDAAGGRVAVKALRGDLVSGAFHDHQLRREVEALRRVAPFCTARIIEVGLDDVRPYLVSEYVPGPDLQTWVEQRGPYGPDELIRLAIGVATALSSIHRAGVTHRDLKPANVLLGPDGPRVIDFGIARTEDMTRSATGLKGTPRWMAPELHQGERPSPAVDVWAWGAITLFAATGRPPFDAETMPALTQRILHHDPDLGVLPKPLRSLAGRALARRPESRPGAMELLEGLIGGEAGGVSLAAGERAAGGLPAAAVPPALAEVAEQAYVRLDPDVRAVVPRVLLRMINVAADADRMLRRVAALEFIDAETGEQTVRQVLDALGAAGLLVRDGEMFTLATPALVRAWPRLRGWVADEDDALDVHHRLTDAARRWHGHGRKGGDLLQGTPLDEAVTRGVAGRRHLTLNLLERAFLDHSVRAARRRSRTRTVASAALAILFIVAATTATVALARGRTVARQRDEAVGARVAGLATTTRHTDPATARQLAVAAASLSPDSYETRNALLTLYNQPEQYIYRPAGVDGTWDATQDGGHLRAYVRGNEVKVADIETRAVRSSFRFSGEPLELLITGPIVSLSSDGRVLSLIRQDHTIGIYDAMTGRQFPEAFRAAPTAAQRLDAHGRRLLIWSRRDEPDGASLWDTTSGKSLLKIPYFFEDADFTPDEKYLITTHGTALDVWDIAAGRKVRTLRLVPGKEKISSFALSPDGKLIALHQGDRLWVGPFNKPEESQMRWRPAPKLPAGEVDMAFSPSGRYVQIGGTIWDTRDDRDQAPNSMPVFKDADHGCLPFSYSFGPGDRSLRCFDSENTVIVVSLSAILNPVQLAVPFGEPVMSQDGSTLAIPVLSSRKWEIWDPLTRVRRGALPLGDYGSLNELSADGRLLAAGSPNGDIEIWDVRSATRKGTLATHHQLLSGFTPIAFSPDDKTLAVLTNDTRQASLLELWDIAAQTRRAASTGQPHPRGQDQILAGEQTDSVRILFGDHGRAVISAPDQGVVDAATGSRLTAPNFASSKPAALNNNGLIAMESVEQKVTLWDGRSLRQVGNTTLSGASGVSGVPAAFSPDGRLLATADTADQIQIWDIARKQALGGPLSGLYRTKGRIGLSTIRSLAFAPDGSTILAIDDHGRLRSHPIAAGKIKAALCAQFGPLTKTDWKTYIPEIPYRNTC
jgi:WD40 repeat protein